MKLTYFFNYGIYDAKGTITVDTNLFTKEKAKELLEFYFWDYDKDADPIDEAIKKYAMKAIELSAKGCPLELIKEEINSLEAYHPLGENTGIDLSDFLYYELELNEDDLTIEKKTCGN